MIMQARHTPSLMTAIDALSIHHSTRRDWGQAAKGEMQGLIPVNSSHSTSKYERIQVMKLTTIGVRFYAICPVTLLT